MKILLPEGKESNMHMTDTKIIYPALFLVSILLSACGGGGGGGAAPGTTTVRSAYVANYGTNNVSQYAIDANGALSLKTTVAAVSGPTSVTVDPSGKYAYVANSFDSVISQYKIVGGVLTQMNPATEISGLAPVSFALDPSGKYAYAANSASNDVTQFSIDPTSGALTNLVTVSAGTSPAYITVTTDLLGKKYAYVVNVGIPTCPAPPTSCVVIAPSISQYSINATTGVLTPMAPEPLALGTDPASITVDPTGKYAYVANYGNSTISQYNIVAGALSPMTPVATVVGVPTTLLSLPTSIAIDPTGTHAYVANGSGVYQYAITNGALVELASPTIYTGGFAQRSITVDGSGKFVYMANQSDGSISQFSIGTGGQLSALSPNYVAGAATSQPYSITTAVSIQ
ncbi:MAG: beta-propeller fold lactonase family protein [Gallionella sp.]